MQFDHHFFMAVIIISRHDHEYSHADAYEATKHTHAPIQCHVLDVTGLAGDCDQTVVHAALVCE